MSSQRTSLIWAIGLGLVAALISRGAAQTGLQNPPELNRPPAAIGCSFTGPLVHVPSKSAGAEGLLVRISPPARGRYPEGAPIAVHMNANRPNVTGSRACLSERGFVDIGFLCPGEEYRDAGGALWKSGGAVVNQASDPAVSRTPWRRLVLCDRQPLAQPKGSQSGTMCRVGDDRKCGHHRVVVRRKSFGARDGPIRRSLSRIEVVRKLGNPYLGACR